MVREASSFATDVCGRERLMLPADISSLLFGQIRSYAHSRTNHRQLLGQIRLALDLRSTPLKYYCVFLGEEDVDVGE